MATCGYGPCWKVTRYQLTGRRSERERSQGGSRWQVGHWSLLLWRHSSGRMPSPLDSILPLADPQQPLRDVRCSSRLHQRTHLIQRLIETHGERIGIAHLVCERSSFGLAVPRGSWGVCRTGNRSMAGQASSGFVAGGGADAVGIPHDVGGVRSVGGVAAVPRSVSSVQLVGVVAGDPLDVAAGGGALRSPRAVGWG